MKISEEASQRVEELTKQGWELTISWTKGLSGNTGQRWEACFTKQLSDGKYDNHEEAVGINLSKVLIKACDYVKDGIKYSRKSHKL